MKTSEFIFREDDVRKLLKRVRGYLKATYLSNDRLQSITITRKPGDRWRAKIHMADREEKP